MGLLKVSQEAQAAFAQMIESGMVLDRVYADINGGINFRAHAVDGERRLHIANNGDLLDRNDPDSYLRRYGVIA